MLSQQIIFSRSLQLQPSNSGKFLNENMLVPPTSWIYIFHYLLLNSWGKLIISLDVNISYNGDSIFFINSLYYKAAAFLFFFFSSWYWLSLLVYILPNELLSCCLQMKAPLFQQRGEKTTKTNNKKKAKKPPAQHMIKRNTACEETEKWREFPWLH